MYVDKNEKRVNTWLKVNRLQLPLLNQNTNSIKETVGLLKNNPSRPVGNAIKDGSFNNSIPKNSKKVNTFEEKNQEKEKKYKSKLNAKGLDVVKVESDGKKVLYAAKTGTESTQYAVSETADLNYKPAGNKSQNLTPLQMKRAESFARTHVKGYENLTAAEKLEVEWTIASGWRYGASESDILSLAKISAQSGVGIGFADLKATTSDGKVVSPDAVCYTSGKHLTIYLNPKSKRTVEVATLHELTHALKGAKGYAELEKMALEYYAKHPEEKAVIDNAYRALYQNEQLRYEKEVLPDELTAHYIEKMLEKRNVLAQLTAEQPTFMQRCINWLKTRVDKLRGVDTQAADEVDILARKFVSTFNLNKNKISTAQQLDKTDKIRYAYKARNPQTVTKSEFEHHYWATANGILTKNELGSLNSAIGEMRNGAQYVKNADGLYMVPVGENGVLNKIVFTDGKYNSYSIDTVITINLNNETDLSIERSIIYASERKGIYTETNGLVEVHYAKDFKFSDFQRKLTQNPQNSNGKQNGAGNLNGDSGNGVKRSYALTVTDSDGKALSAAQQDYFKDTVVRDKNGRLLTVYHGSPNVFTEFSHRFMNTNGNAHGRGFYFTDDAEYNERKSLPPPVVITRSETTK